MSYSNWYFLVVLIAICTSCNQRPIFSKKIDIDGDWAYANSLVFPVPVDDLNQHYDLILSLVYSTDFSYQNIYVKITTQYPNNEAIEDILSLNLTDGSGTFLGDCNSSECEIDILLQERFKFKEKGTHTISIAQHGREEQLSGIYGAELKLYELQ